MAAFDFPRDYDRLGEELARDTASEASLRTAVSRYYYAVYHKARDKAPTHGVTIAKLGGFTDHQACWAAYQANPSKTEFGNSGNRLKELRVTADYDASNVDKNGKAVNWEDKVAEAESLAKDVLARL